MRKLSLGISPLLVFVSMACGGGTEGLATPVSLTTLTIEAATAPQSVGTTRQFTAVATFSDHSIRDVTSRTTWASDARHVVTITQSGGRETALKPGEATIFATFRAFGKTVTASATVRVTAPRSWPMTIESAILQREMGMSSPHGANGILTERTTPAMTKGPSWAGGGASMPRPHNIAERVGWVKACAARRKSSHSEAEIRNQKNNHEQSDD